LADALEMLRAIGQGERNVEAAVGYSVGHRIRIEIVAALHEGPKSAAELTKILQQPHSNLANHIKELLNDGWIGIAKTENVRNFEQHYYRVIKLTEFSDEDVAAMTLEERHALYALIIQASTAEAMASLWSGRISHDPRVVMMWNRINLDLEGREALAEEQVRSWERIVQIEVEAANRRAKSGELGKSYIIASFGYERQRITAPEPLGEIEDWSDALHSIGGQRGIEDAVSFSIGHRVRIEILAALHEGPQTISGLSNTLRRPTNSIWNHLMRLRDDGWVTVEKTVQVGNVRQAYYRVVKLPEFSDEDIAAMSFPERQAVFALIIQASTAEAMASLYAGKIVRDSRAVMMWNRIQLDKQGREALADEQARSWHRIKQIEAEAADRLPHESETTYIATSLGFERSRAAPPEPLEPELERG
jgi:DNA-binding transcriptional ArsR family regulator